MSQSLIDQLAELRERQGKPPLPDPTQIEGFGPSDPPSPRFTPPVASGQDTFAEPEGDDQHRTPLPGPAPSPLVAAGRPQAASPPAPPLQLAVFDAEAAYLGRAVKLNEREQRGVTAIVLRALQRVVTEQLEEIRKLSPRRASRKTPTAEVPSAAMGRRRRRRASLLGPKL